MQTEILVWGINIGPDSKGTQSVIREFERLNPQYKVRVLGMGAGGMDPQKLMTSIVGNVAPDTVVQDRFALSDWASRGAFRSLDEFIVRDQAADPLCPTAAQYYPAPWNEAIYEGKIYGIPVAADDRILYINRGLFRKAAARLKAVGLDPEGVPKTWSEVLAYSKVLTERKADGSLIRAGFMPNFGNSWLYMYAFQTNANFMSADGRKCTLYSPESERALQFMLEGYEIVGGYENAKKFESGFQSGINDAFVTGKVAMKVDGDWILKDLARYGPQVTIDVGPPPVPDDRLSKTGPFKNEKDAYVSWMGGFAYAIPKGARNPEGAWDFIKFTTSQKGRLIEIRGQQAWEKRRGRIFIPSMVAHRPTNELILKDFMPPIEQYAKGLKMHIEMAKVCRGRPPTFVAQTLWNEHSKAMDVALYKRATPKEALLAGQAAVQRELDAFYEREKYPVFSVSIAVQISVVAICLGLGWLWLNFRRARLGKLARHEARAGYFFISPWVFGVALFTLGPMIASLVFSFTQYDVLNEARWVGLKNYQDLAGVDLPLMKKAFGNAFYLAAVGVPLGLITGLAVALLLNVGVRGMKYYRTLFYMPAIVPGIASAVLWSWILAADPNKGLINSLWRDTITAWLGLSEPAWVNSASWSKPALILMGLWGAGSGMILWLAGLKGVPTTLYEAAQIDGATSWRMFWSVTFPQISSIVFFNAVMGLIGAMQEFDRIYVMKPPGDGLVGPDDSMLTPVFLLFNDAFKFFKMGHASAIAWVVFAVIVGLTALQFRFQSKWVHYEVDK